MNNYLYLYNAIISKLSLQSPPALNLNSIIIKKKLFIKRYYNVNINLINNIIK